MFTCKQSFLTKLLIYGLLDLVLGAAGKWNCEMFWASVIPIS